MRLGRAAAITALMAGTVAGSAAGQINTERLRRPVTQPGVSGAAAAELTVRTGNVDVALLGISGRLERTGTKTNTFLIASGDLGWQGGRRFSDQGLVHLRQAYGWRRAIYPEAFTQVDYDRSRALAFRGLVGAGLRFRLTQGPRWRLYAGTAYMLEVERLDLPPTAIHPARVTAHRWSNYLSANLETARWRLVATAYVQPRFDAPGDLRLLHDAGLAVPLADGVALTTTFNLRYDSRPPDGVRPTDTTLKTGVALQW